MVHGVPKITLRHMAYFVAVADARSFRAAAKALNVSQPPLSQQIQSLEATLGVKLIDRQNKQGFLTDAGEEFYRLAQQTLDMLSVRTTYLHALGRGLSGRLKVGMTDVFLSGPLMSRLIDFMRANPDVEVETHVAQTGALLESIKSGSIDLVLVSGYLTEDIDPLNCIQLAAERIVVVVPQDHHLAGRDEVKLHDLAKQTVIPMPADLQSPFCNTLVEAVPGAKLVNPCSNTVIGIKLVRAGIGITFTTEHAIIDTAGVRVLTLDDARAYLPAFLISRQLSYSLALNKLVNHLTAED